MVISPVKVMYLYRKNQDHYYLKLFLKTNILFIYEYYARGIKVLIQCLIASIRVTYDCFGSNITEKFSWKVNGQSQAQWCNIFCFRKSLKSKHECFHQRKTLLTMLKNCFWLKTIVKIQWKFILVPCTVLWDWKHVNLSNACSPSLSLHNDTKIFHLSINLKTDRRIRWTTPNPAVLKPLYRNARIHTLYVYFNYLLIWNNLDSIVCGVRKQ